MNIEEEPRYGTATGKEVWTIGSVELRVRGSNPGWGSNLKKSLGRVSENILEKHTPSHVGCTLGSHDTVGSITDFGHKRCAAVTPPTDHHSGDKLSFRYNAWESGSLINPRIGEV